MTSTTADSGTVLVTGAAGFAGTHLCAQLLEEGRSVHALTRSGATPPGTEGHAFDVADREALTALIEQVRPSSVFHLAAIVDTVTTPSIEELERVNVGGTQAVADAVSAIDPAIRIVFASSAFVYGRTTPDEQPIGEAQPLRPLTPYGETKVAAENVLLAHAASGGDAVIARAFQHTGPGHVGAYALSDWAEQLARIELAGGSGEIATGTLDVERDYLDVRDVVSAYRALARAGESGSIYNVCSGSGVTMRLLLEGLIDAFGIDVAIVTDEARLRAVDQPVVVGDRTALSDATGWQPHYSLEQTLTDLAEFWRRRVREAN
ncbi:MAG: NAD-dependent epimerase/dehydratase family protein [Thermoleophilaceae bacterium]|nr:NAD-dependent epimerase/dehydratase family protein [Thermoleophilaceae bacterium]